MESGVTNEKSVSCELHASLDRRISRNENTSNVNRIVRVTNGDRKSSFAILPMKKSHLKYVVSSKDHGMISVVVFYFEPWTLVLNNENVYFEECRLRSASNQSCVEDGTGNIS